jgi:cyanophycinase-like exopeptidase
MGANALATHAKPVYLLAGGRGSPRTRPDPLIAEVFAASGKPRPRIAYIGAPSEDNRVFFIMLSKIMKGSGAGRVELVRLAGKKPDLVAARATIAAADVVFMTGGDVEFGMDLLGRTGMLPVLHERLAAGIPFFGMSAGSIMLASHWIRWLDPEDDSTAAPFPCMGFAPLVCDAHGEADGWVELVALLGLMPQGTVGYGIVTGAGIRSMPDGTVSAMGGAVHRFRRGAGGVERIEDLAPDRS